MEYLNMTFLGNTVIDYIVTLLIILGGVIVIYAIKTYVFSQLEKKAEKTNNKFDDLLVNVLGKTLIPALYIGAIYLSLQHLDLNETLNKVLEITGLVVVTFLVVRFIIAIINYALLHYWIQKVDNEDTVRNVKSIMPIIKVVVYAIGIFFLLDNLGVKISTLVAGLGVGGVAVALAGQAILGDLFSYFSILFDRPFELGDFVIVDQHMGTIEHVGIKTTRIRSLGGEQIVLSNSDLTNSRVKNFKRMEQRRVVFHLGVIYQTTTEQLKMIPAIIKDVIENIEMTKFDRAHFYKYGDFSLDFEIVYYVFSKDYNIYMDIQQKINLALFEKFGAEKIEFAYPTQTLFMEKG